MKMNQYDHDIDHLLRQAYERVRAQPPAAPSPEEPGDYYLLARALDGSITAEERAVLLQRMAADPLLAEVLHHAEHARPRVLRRWHVVPILLRCAACFLLAVPLYFAASYVCSWRKTLGDVPAPYPAPDAGTKPLLELRGAPTNDLASTNAVSAVAPPDPVVIYTRTADSLSTAVQELVLYDASYAVIVGIDAYDPARTGFSPLRCAASDAKLVAAKLDEFRLTGITTLLNSNATRAAILAALESAIATAGRNGAVLLYFAGHGHRHTAGATETGFLIPWDGSLRRDELFARNLSLNEIKRLALRRGVKHFYIVLDACYSGLICFRGPEFSMRAPDFFYLKELSVKPVIQVLAASGHDTPTIDGLFSKAFVAALDRGKERGFTTARDIDRYVSKFVAKNARHTYAFEQTPVAGKLEPSVGEYVFVSKTQAPVTYTEPGLVRIASYPMPPGQDNYDIICADINEDGRPAASNSATRFCDRAWQLIQKGTSGS